MSIQSALRTAGREFDVIFKKGSYTVQNEYIFRIVSKYEGQRFSTVMRCVEVEIDISQLSSFSIGQSVSLQIGVNDNGTFIYKDFGSYTIYDIEKNEDLKSFNLICYDKMLKTMVQNSLSLTSGTVQSYFNAVCSALGFSNCVFSTTPPNLNLQVSADLSELTCRQVLDYICQITGVTLFHNGTTLYGETYSSTNEVNIIGDDINGEAVISDLRHFGRVQVEYINNDDESVIYSATEQEYTNSNLTLSISNNPFVSNSNAQTIANNLLPFVSATDFYDCSIDTFGVLWVSEYLKQNVEINSNTYTIFPLSSLITFDGGLKQKIECKSIEEDNYTEGYDISTYAAITARKASSASQRALQQANDLAERVSENTNAINRTLDGNAQLVDLEYDSTNDVWYIGDGLPDTLIISQYPAVNPGGSDWNTGLVIKMNYSGMGFSTEGISGGQNGYTDFAIAYDSTLNKYVVNANDIKVGTLSGIFCDIANGKIGGWNIGKWEQGQEEHEGISKTFSYEEAGLTKYVTFAIDSYNGSSNANYLLQIFQSDSQGTPTSNYLFGVQPNGTVECSFLSSKNAEITKWNSSGNNDSTNQRYWKSGNMLVITGTYTFSNLSANVQSETKTINFIGSEAGKKPVFLPGTIPKITVSPIASNANFFCDAKHYNASATGFSLCAMRTTSGNLSVDWIAIGEAL